jgi:hypothetical protein
MFNLTEGKFRGNIKNEKELLKPIKAPKGPKRHKWFLIKLPLR